jgi:4,5-DOPA dioxygenase extradiol
VRQPVIFLAHGAPTLAIDGGAWGPALREYGTSLPRPGAILVISAHWETSGSPRITSASRPGVIHDFGGFPEALYQLDYPAMGDPLLAARLAKAVCADLDGARPLDHGAWVPLRWMFPEANVPVLQLSLPRPRDFLSMLRLGEALRVFRDEGFLIVGSGGLVHNLRRLDWEGGGDPEPWAAGFEDWVMHALLTMGPQEFAAALPGAPHLREAVPTTEHFDPLLVALGAAGPDAGFRTLFAGWQMGNLSLRCLEWL